MTSRERKYLTVTDRERFQDRDAFVAAWFNHAGSFWSWNGLSSLCQVDPDEAWRLILLLVERAHSDTDVVVVALNPLTELLIEHGDLIIDRIEAETAQNQRLRRCLGEMYQNDGAADISPKVWARIVRLQNGAA